MNELGEEQQEPTTIQEENRRQPEYCPKKPVTYAILQKVDAEDVFYVHIRICGGLLHGRLNDALE